MSEESVVALVERAPGSARIVGRRGAGWVSHPGECNLITGEHPWVSGPR